MFDDGNDCGYEFVASALAAEDQGVEYIRFDKVDWLRGMVKHALKVGRDWKEAARVSKAENRGISKRSFEVRRMNDKLRVENAALREAGRGLFRVANWAQQESGGGFASELATWRKVAGDE